MLFIPIMSWSWLNELPTPVQTVPFLGSNGTPEATQWTIPHFYKLAQHQIFLIYNQK